MMLLRITTIFLCAGLITIQAEESIHQTTIGTDPSLSAGVFALRMGNYEEGVSLILDGMDSAMTSRNRASAFNNLCAGYVGIRKFIKALEACNKALAINDRNWRIYNNHALALLNAGRIVAARDALEKGLALNPDSPTLAKVADMIDTQARSRVVLADSKRY